MSRKEKVESIEPLDWERAVEITTPGNFPNDIKELERLGQTAQAITTHRTNGGGEVHKRPDGQFISPAVAEAIRSGANPESQKLSYDDREIIKGKKEDIKERLEAVERGELPLNTKRDFTLNKEEQLKQVRASLEKERASLDGELGLSNQLFGLDHQKEAERHRQAAKNTAKIKAKRELRERQLLNAELKRTQDEAYQAELAKLEPELSRKIANLEGSSEQRYHRAEQLKLEARKEAKQRAEETAKERKKAVEEVGGPGTINKLRAEEAERKLRAEEAERKLRAEEAEELKKAEFKERHGVGQKRNERPKKDPQSINDGPAPVKPDRISSQAWWAMNGEQRRNVLRDPKHIWFDNKWAERYDQLDSADFDAKGALEDLKRQWLVEIGAIDSFDNIGLDRVSPAIIGAALTRKADSSFGGDMNKLKEWARSGEWMKLEQQSDGYDDDDENESIPFWGPLDSDSDQAEHRSNVTSSTSPSTVPSYEDSWGSDEPWSPSDLDDDWIGFIPDPDPSDVPVSPWAPSQPSAVTPLPPVTATQPQPASVAHPGVITLPPITPPADLLGGSGSGRSRGISAFDAVKNHAGGLSLIGAGVLAQLFAEASASKAAGFTLLTGALVKGSRELWNKANSVARGLGGMAVAFSGAQALTGDYFDGKNLVAAGLGAGFGLGFKKGKKVMESVLKRIEGNGDADSKRTRKKWAKVGAIVAMTAAITTSAVYMAVQGSGSSAESTNATATSTIVAEPSASTESAPASTNGVNPDNNETSNSGELSTEDVIKNQRAGVKARAIELGIELSDEQVNQVVDNALRNLSTGTEADYISMTAIDEMPQRLTDLQIKDVAGLVS